MSDVLWWVLSSTLFGGLLVCAGAALWAWKRSLAWAYALVFLGMAKLVTPTLLQPPVAMPDLFAMQREPSPTSPRVAELARPKPGSMSTLEATPALLAEPSAAPTAGAEEDGLVLMLEPIETVRETASATPSASTMVDWAMLGRVVLGVWGLGAVALMVIGWRRTRRCRELLRHAHVGSPGLTQEVALLSDWLGLRRVPEVRVVDADISPFAVTFGRSSTVVLPRVLLQSLNRREVRSILAHELCHVASGDVWARRLELAVVTLHWWNPIAHWARAWLRHLEELRCDARAVELTGDGSRHYGRSLLKATAILDGDLSSLPLTASGLGGASSLKTRLRMMTVGSMESRLGVRSRCALFAGAASLLPLGVAAQDPAKAPTSPEPSKAAAVERELLELRATIDRLLAERGAEAAPPAPAAGPERGPRPETAFEAPSPFAAPPRPQRPAPALKAPEASPSITFAPHTLWPTATGGTHGWSVGLRADAHGSSDGEDAHVSVKIRGEIDGEPFEADSIEELGELLGDKVRIEAVDGRFGIGLHADTGARARIVMPKGLFDLAEAPFPIEDTDGDGRFVWHVQPTVEGAPDAVAPPFPKPAPSFWSVPVKPAGEPKLWWMHDRTPFAPDAGAPDALPEGEIDALQERVRELEARIRQLQERMGQRRRDA